MKKFNFVATNSKMLRIVGFDTLADAESQAAAWDAMAPAGHHDVEAESVIYSWDDWQALADANEADPLDCVENA